MALPLFQDNRWDPDTLFLIFENDYRFRDEWNTPADNLRSPSTAAASNAAPSATQPPPAKPTGHVAVGNFFAIPCKAPEGEFAAPRPDITNVMRMAAVAARKNKGDLIWFCWQPSGADAPKVKTSKIKSGAMFVAITPAGATAVSAAVTAGTIPPGHWDVGLLGYLLSQPPGLGACYLLPPLGNYTTHVSHCETMPSLENKVRKNCWGMRWACQGTDEAEDTKGRQKWFVNFTAAGQPDWIVRAGGKTLKDTPPWRSYKVMAESGSADTVGKPASKRQKRDRRTARLNMTRRVWTDDRAEVCLWDKHISSIPYSSVDTIIAFVFPFIF